MTFTEIVNTVAGRLNLTSSEALVRIGDEVNGHYRRIAASMGLETTTRGTVTASTSVGDQTVTFSNVTKLFTVLGTDSKPLGERDYDYLIGQEPRSDPPHEYAVKRIGATSVTILLDCEPASIYTLSADALQITSTLSGSTAPAFPENYHEILVLLTMADELDKLEKYDAAQRKQAQGEGLLSDLRLFLAKSAYLKIYPGAR